MCSPVYIIITVSRGRIICLQVCLDLSTFPFAFISWLNLWKAKLITTKFLIQSMEDIFRASDLYHRGIVRAFTPALFSSVELH